MLAPLGYRGSRAREALHPRDRWSTGAGPRWSRSQEIQASGAARPAVPHRPAAESRRPDARHRARRLADAPSARASDDLMHEVDEHALRLDAALTFDEVRTIATMQERHRLAREIHDGVAQEIASLGYVVDDLTASATSDAQRRKLHGLRGELTARGERAEAVDLRPPFRALGRPGVRALRLRARGRRSFRHDRPHDAWTWRRPGSEARSRPSCSASPRRPSPTLASTPRPRTSGSTAGSGHPPPASASVTTAAVSARPRDDSYGIKIMRERADRIEATLEIASDAVGKTAPGDLRDRYSGRRGRGARVIRQGEGS